MLDYTHCKTKNTMGICQPHQREGANFIGVGSDSLTNPKKVCAGNIRIKNADLPRDGYSGDNKCKNSWTRMDLE